MIISYETTGYETVHEILLTLACHLGGATLHSAVVSLNQRDVCLKQALFHPFETTLIDEGCLLLATESVDGVAFCDVILHDMFAKSFTGVAIA